MAKRKKLNRSILILIIVSIVVSVGIGTFNIMNIVETAKTNLDLYKKTLNDDYDKNIRTATQQAISTLNGIYQQEQQGKLTEAQAKAEAVVIMTQMRYGDDGNGYYWGDTTDGICVFHGTNPKVVGTDRNNTVDSKGFLMIKAILKAGENGGGYVDFWFPKADPNDMTDNLRELVGKVAQSSAVVASTSQELTNGAEQSAQASNQIAVAITEVSQGTEKQLRAVDHTTHIVDQISKGIDQILASSQIVANTSKKAADSALEGSKAIDKTIIQMNNIEKTVVSSAQVIDRLGERSNEISQIIDTISGIAEQTNLLALNAAIEAARAGDQGRGFAVVANEVRKLAEQSGEATKQISGLITQIQDDTQNAVSAMSKGTQEVSVGADVVKTADKAFREINNLVDTVSTQVQGISSEIQQTVAGSKQIVDAVFEINEISRTIADQTQTVSAATQEQSASIEEIASSSQMLSQMARELETSLTKFTV